VGSTLEVELRHRLSRLDLHLRLSVGPETVGLVGPSGAGKSTVLRAIAGLVRPREGLIVHDGRVLLDTDRAVDLPPERRRVGMVYQDGALFPFLSVLQNVTFGIRGERRGRERQGLAVLERFGILHLARARPAHLSGGERRRVALARAMAPEPEILLLDEPLSALDSVARGEVAAELEAHTRELGIPTLLVTHDFADVLGLAGRAAVLQAGRIVQDARVSDLVEAPASPFVASLTGVNFSAGVAGRRGELTEVRGEGWPAPVFSTDEGSGPVGMVVYPWEVSLSSARPEGSALNAVTGTVRRITILGNRARVTLDTRPPIVAEVTEESLRHLELSPGRVMTATWKATATRVVQGSSPGPVDPA
jgi:molybdate transport system ATP-binding protein